jgi:hypothetical protein
MEEQIMNENNVNVKEIEKDVLLLLQEQQSLQKEIETLNENIKRKDEIISGFYEIIMNTKDIELIKQAELVMAKANFGNKIKGV